MDLRHLHGIGRESLELLDAAGYQDVFALANATAADLTSELARANEMLKIAQSPPTEADSAGWIEAARELAGPPDDSSDRGFLMDSEPRSSNYSGFDEIQSRVLRATMAIPLPTRFLIDQQLSVADIPEAEPFDGRSEQVELDPAAPQPRSTGKPNNAVQQFVRLAEVSNTRPGIDPSKIRSTSSAPESIPASIAPSDPRVALIRAPRPTTNQGRNPHSRRYIRGVLHSRPISMYCGALATMAAMVMIPLAVTSSLLLLLSAEAPQSFGWVPKWLLAFPLSMPLFGLAFLIWGVGGSCRVCGQKLFVHKSHLKNVKAHHIRGLGYIFPLCMQMILFRWFRCTHCGTPIRLKE